MDSDDVRGTRLNNPFLGVLLLVPAIPAATLLTADLPILWSHAREIAGYFQTVALIEYGLRSLFILSPAESYSSIHLHSILSSPLVAAGYIEGGRLVSWLAAVTSSVTVYGIILRLYGNPMGGLLAGCLLWLHPLFYRLSYAYMPETLSIALTTVAVYAVLRYYQSEKRLWIGIAAFSIVLGITNHMWEATILAPVVAVLLVDRKVVPAFAMSVLTVTTVVAVYLITSLQPTSGSTLTGYGTQSVGLGFFTTLGFWIPVNSAHPLYVAIAATMPLSLLGIVYWLYKARTKPTHIWVVMATWHLSALTIPLFLARGYSIHPYYSWAQLAPLAITGAIWIVEITHLVGPWFSDIGTPEEFQRYAVIGVVVLVLIYALIFDVGILSGMGLPVVGAATIPADHVAMEFGADDYRRAADEIQEADVDRSSQIVFVGEWGGSNPPTSYTVTLEATKILIYSGISIPERRILPGNGGPRFAKNRTEALDTPNCEIMVIRKGDTILTELC